MGKQVGKASRLLLVASCVLAAASLQAAELEAHGYELDLGEWQDSSFAYPDDGLFATVVDFGVETLNLDFDMAQNHISAAYPLDLQPSLQLRVGVRGYWVSDDYAALPEPEYFSVGLRYSF